MRLEPKDGRRKVKGRREDVLAEVIGICEGPADLADRHDSYAY
jgi:hypothetical protein